MSAQRRLARFNRAVGNRLVGRGLSAVPGFGAVVHRGRKSGREYRTPVKVFRRGPAYVISLPYGPDSDWVRNVLAAGGCELATHAGRIRLGEPRLHQGAAPDLVPAPFRLGLRRLGVVHFIELRAQEPRPSPARPSGR